MDRADFLPLGELIECLDDGIGVRVYDIDDSTLLCEYDGRQSIDPKYNQCDVGFITLAWHEDVMEVYIHLPF